MKKPENLKAGDQFRVRERCFNFHLGEIISLKEDDGSDNPFFWKADKPSYHSIHFSKLEPVAKTAKPKGGKDKMKKPENLKAGDQFRVSERYNSFNIGEKVYILHASEHSYPIILQLAINSISIYINDKNEIEINYGFVSVHFASMDENKVFRTKKELLENLESRVD